MQRRSHMWTQSRNVAVFSGPKPILNGQRQNAKLFCDQINQNLKFHFGNPWWCVLQTQENRNNPACFQGGVQKLHLWWYGAAFIPMAWAASTSGKAPSILKSTQRFLKQHMLLSSPVYFSKTMPNHILSQQHGFRGEESRCWTGLPAIQTFHQ